jgi:hypothetical protein
VVRFAATLAAVLGLALPGPAWAQTVLDGSVGVIGIQMPVTQSGVSVSTLPPGSYQLRVMDRTGGHNFHLLGPGVEERTGIPEIENVVWDVDFTHGRYDWFCDVHPTAMYGTVTVGNFLVVEKQGVGTIESNPPGIACGPFCEAAYPAGGTVELTPSAPSGYVFKGWIQGSCTGTGPCTVDVQGTVELTGRFEKVPTTSPPPPPPGPPPPATAPASIVSAKASRIAGKRVLAVVLKVRRPVDAVAQLRSGRRIHATKRARLSEGTRTIKIAVPRNLRVGSYGLRVKLVEFLTGHELTLRRTVRIPK